MPNDYDFDVGFNVDLTGLTKGFDKAKAEARGLETQMKTAGSKIGTGFTSGVGKITALAGSFNVVTMAAQSALQVITQVAAAMVDYSRLADQAEKSTRYFDDTLGVLADKGHDWAASLADSYGLYTTDVESYMGSLMEAFQRAGNGLTESYNMAKDFTQLSWDLSAYFPNYSLDEIQEMLLDLARGGGEEALEKLASGFDEEELKARAVAMGIAEIGEELSVLQKQQAAYDIIMGEHGDMQGLYAETDNATTALDRMNNSFTTLKETLGQVFSPVVEAVANFIGDLFDAITDGIDDLMAKWDKLVSRVRGGVNWLSNLLGFGDVWKAESDGAEQAAVSTDKLESALASLEKTAESTKATMEGLAGFDRLYTVKDTGDKEADFDIGNMGDWESAVDEWLAMFLTVPDEAIDKMDPVWDAMLDANVSNIDEFRDMFEDYFNWMAESELANSEYTTEQKQEIIDELIEYMYEANQSYQEQLKALNDEYDQMEQEAELGMTEMTLEQVQAMREQAIQTLRDSYETNMTGAFMKVLEEFGIATEEEVLAMQKAFDAKVKAIEEAYNSVFDYLKEQLDELNAKIAAAKAELAETQRKQEEASKKGFWQNVADEISNPQENEFWKNLGVGDGVGLFAQGGLFPPNSPQLVVMGDDTVEPEVAAPRSMIEDAVQNVINRNGGISGSSPQTIVIEVPLTLDGKEVARASYKYLVQESKRPGNRAGFP